MRECLRKGINPEGKEAPEDIVKAQETFFNIKQGSLWDVIPSKRRELAENICFIATGRKDSPCYSIIDRGEGQTPKKMPDTFLSLSKTNKLRIPFVQGKFNMGGTGVLQFSGRNNLQLVLSRRDPEISKLQTNDETREHWGFTIVRRENPRENRRSSTYTYLVINGKIPMFRAKSLPLIPGDYPEAYKEPLEWGTLIKLYEYQMPGGLKTNILFDLYNRICLLLPRIALPVRFYERRRGYTGHTFETTMSGLFVRLFEDKRTNLEDGFPSSSTLSVSNEKMDCQIFAFKKGQSEKYRENEGIIFTINGQTQGHIPSSIFSRKSTGMAYLSESILITVDCTNVSGRTREDLFMNSRDRLRETELKKAIEKHLEELIRDHPGLRALRESRRREDIEDKLSDSKPLKDVLEDIFRKSPALASLLGTGVKITSPFNLRHVANREAYIGKEFPTYFKLRLKGKKLCPVNSKFRVQYETDAVNEYFKRDTRPGEYKLSIIEENSKFDYILNLWEGLASLTASLPENAEIGKTYCYKSYVTDPTRLVPFEDQFEIEVIKEVEKEESKAGRRKKPPSEKEGKDREASTNLALPEVIPVYENEWEKYGFNERSALKVMDTGENSYDYYINMDNLFLLLEIKTNYNVDAQLIKDKYKYALVLIGMALLKGYLENDKKSDDDDITKIILGTTSQLSPIILPMISYLGELQLEE